jgi:UDP-glucose 6-dehydrogenase
VHVKIAVIGTGHVGLVTAVAMAILGHDVVGTDSDAEKITALQAGVSPFFEPVWRRRWDRPSSEETSPSRTR